MRALASLMKRQEETTLLKGVTNTRIIPIGALRHIARATPIIRPGSAMLPGRDTALILPRTIIQVAMATAGVATTIMVVVMEITIINGL